MTASYNEEKQRQNWKSKPSSGCFTNPQLHFALWKVHQDHFTLCIAPFLQKQPLLFLTSKIYFSFWLMGWRHTSNLSLSAKTLPSWCPLNDAPFHSSISPFGCTLALLHRALLLLFLLRQGSSNAPRTPVWAGSLHTGDIIFFHTETLKRGNRFLLST